MRRLLLVLVLAAVTAQPAFADPKDEGDRGRGRGEVRSRDRGAPAREQRGERAREVRARDEARSERAREVRARDEARSERGREVRARDEARSERGREVRVRDEARAERAREERGPVVRTRDESRSEGREQRGPVVRRRDEARPEAARPRVIYRGDAPRPQGGEQVRGNVRYKGDPGRGGVYDRGPGAAGMRVGRVRGWQRGPMPGPSIGQRGRVYLSPGFPLRRSPRYVFVRRHPAFWGPIVYWGPTFYFHARFVSLPARDHLVWEDSEILYRGDGWTDFSLDVDDYGGGLFMEVTGPTQVDWAEVVFNDGRARVVDFGGDVLRPGIYSLLDFSGERDVAYVRLVARAVSPRARVILSMSRW